MLMASLYGKPLIYQLSGCVKAAFGHLHRLHPVPRKVSEVKYSQWRRFSVSASQPASRNSARTSRNSNIKLKYNLRAPAAVSGDRSAYQSYADSFANRTSPTLLYEAPTPNLFIAGCYTLSAVCFVYAGTNFYNNYLHPPEHIGAWIPVMFGGICIAAGVLGVRFIFGVGVLRLVKSQP